MPAPVNIFWFRRDLRLTDNAGLYHALRDDNPVVPVFIFDRNILDELDDKADRRVKFIHQGLDSLQKKLQKQGSTLDVRYGYLEKVFQQLISEYNVAGVFANHDYEPYANERDNRIKDLLQVKGIAFHSYKDQVIFEKNEVLKDDGKPYTVFTPYSRKWKSQLKPFYLKSYPAEKYFQNFFKQKEKGIPSLSSMGFRSTNISFPSPGWEKNLIKNYKEQRDIPAMNGTSRLSVHLRFGTISVRKLVRDTMTLSETFLNELIWRDFYQMILWHFPHVVTESFKPAYDRIRWRNDESEFKKWCDGKTGYPIVDAGMRELNATGYMHNRVRMIVASFLTKHLLIDWRWGEAYFAKKLLDYDLAANNGGWQWAAGSGCDAVPYFRIFNPYTQAKKFDPDHQYIKKWLPELDSPEYPIPIVDHGEAGKQCRAAYQAALRGSGKFSHYLSSDHQIGD